MESSKSSALSETATGLSGTSTSGIPVPVITDEQVQLKLTPVAEGLNLPSDIAVAPDGSLFVAERDGTVRLIRGGSLVDAPALDIKDELRLPEGGLLSIELDQKFGDNGLMFALYAAEAPRDGLEFVLARFRSVNGVFADRAVLLDRIPASTSGASGTVRIGPDGKMYLAIDSSADQRVAGSFATYNGKVLRLNTDATTPGDQSGSTPIFSLDHPHPSAMDWQPSTGTLWVVDRLGTDAGRLSEVTSGDPNQRRGASRTSYALPQGTGATSASFYRGDLMPIFKNNFFVAAAGARELIRLRFDPHNASKIVSVERMLRDRIGGVRVVTEAPDGSIYLASESTVYRLAP
jgi:glucose/arabinose dehydrogenase